MTKDDLTKTFKYRDTTEICRCLREERNISSYHLMYELKAIQDFYVIYHVLCHKKLDNNHIKYTLAFLENTKDYEYFKYMAIFSRNIKSSNINRALRLNSLTLRSYAIDRLFQPDVVLLP